MTKQKNDDKNCAKQQISQTYNSTDVENNHVRVEVNKGAVIPGIDPNTIPDEPKETISDDELAWLDWVVGG